MTEGASSPTSVRLKYRGADVFLSQGSYVIGRSAVCQLVIDDARASRRHARIVVGKGAVSIEDLGSINGVFVNGHRVQGKQPLEDGDRIGIGGTELVLKLGGPTSSRRDRPTLGTPVSARAPALAPSSRPDSEAPLTPIQPVDSEPPLSGSGTQRADAFELVGPIAARALAAGRFAEAENILNAHLSKTLEDARKQRAISVSTRTAALAHAIELAHALGSAKWLSYAFELLELCRWPLDDRLASGLMAAIGRTETIDLGRINAYASMLRALPESFEKVRAQHLVDELLRAAARKR